jgi:NIPSNAP
MENGMFTCFIQYKVELDKLDEFREYARSWISLMRKHGGTHHGYFLPGKMGTICQMRGLVFPG